MAERLIAAHKAEIEAAKATVAQAKSKNVTQLIVDETVAAEVAETVKRQRRASRRTMPPASASTRR
jgi:hypothetical protein